MGTVNYKTSFDDQNFKQMSIIRHLRKPLVLPDTVPIISKSFRKISDKKYQHLQDLLQWIPECLREFYQNLPHGKEEESDDES